MADRWSVMKRILGAVKRRINGGRSHPAAAASPGWVGVLHTARWGSDGALELSGWAHDSQRNYAGRQPQVRLSAHSASGRTSVEAAVRMESSQEPNLAARTTADEWDYAPTSFIASIDPRLLAEHGDWQLRLQVIDKEVRDEGPFTRLVAAGSAGYLYPATLEGRRVLPVWRSGSGLILRVGDPVATVESCRIDGPRVEIEVAAVDGLRAANLVSKLGSVSLLVEGRRLLAELPSLDAEADWPQEGPGRWFDSTVLAADGLPALRHRLELVTASGVAPVEAAPGLACAGDDQELRTETGPSGEFWIVQSAAQLVVDDVRLIDGDQPRLAVRGRAFGAARGSTVSLVGRMEQVSAPLSIDEQGGASAELPLLISRWEQPPASLVMGRYLLQASDASGRRYLATCSREVIEQARKVQVGFWFRYRAEVVKGRQLAIQLARALADDEVGPVNQARLKAGYEQSGHTPRDLVYLETFYGRQVGCNTLAVEELIRKRRPELERVWAVSDRSVAVPEGAAGVVDGSRAWWEARGSARWVVTNDWLRVRFRHQPHQVVLQTWHGTMFKRIGLDLAGMTSDREPMYLEECGKWDLLVSQNPHSSDVFRSAYHWKRDLVEVGYPRNDILHTGSDEPARRLLGISAAKKVILYAPTWRDDHTDVITHLDVAELAERLGDDYVVLLRGHWRPLRVGDAPDMGARAIDVSTYPNIADLFLLADAVITDYSSLMFDYSVTGKPMIFFVPDLEEYTASRGVYFDLAQEAPGPLVDTIEGVVESVLDLDQAKDRFAERYQAWQQRYNPWDDGHSSERAVDLLFSTRPGDDEA